MMFYFHIFIAAMLYYLFSALWFSPVLAGPLWMKLLHWDINEIQNMKMSKTQLFFMYFSAFFAGLILAVVQAFFLKNLFKGIGFWQYILLMIALLISFLYMPALPNYFFKSFKLNISLKQAAMLWVVEMKPVGISVLIQAVYLYFML